MFKRFTCMILSFVLLLALVPAAAFEASAASTATSDNAITILKKLESFSDKCDRNGYTGYGTKCEEVGRHGITTPHSPACNTNGYLKDGKTKCDKTDGLHGAVHTIRENEADAALRTALKTIDTAINTFASNRGITLSQQQHDALAVFSFENGTGWTKGTDDLQNAVANKITGRNFVKVMEGWSVTDSNARRQVEANMYLFGEYNTTASRLETNLTKQEKDEAGKVTDYVDDYRVSATVTNAYINVREKPSLYGTKIGTVYYGDIVNIVRGTVTEAMGYLWGLALDEDYKEIGYIALMYTSYDDVVAAAKYQEKLEASITDNVVAKATVNVNGYVNVRSGAGTKNPIISSLRDGTTVDLYEVKYVNGQRWGRYSVGWFSLAYANLTNEKTNKYDTNDYNYINFLFTGKLKSGATLYKTKNVSDPLTLTAAEQAKTWEIGNISVNGSNIWGQTTKGWALMGDIELNAATFTTITEVTVRKNPSVNAERKDYLAKGTEFDVDLIEADENTIWGFSDNLGTTDNKYEGWIDLSTQYVTRKGAELKKEPDTSKEKVTLATVINCVELNVRNKPNIFGTKVTTLPAGTTVEVADGPVNGTRKTGWYMLNILRGDGMESWVRGDYLDVREGTRGEINYGVDSAVTTSPDGTQAATGRGMVANTYGGVNVRTAPGTANAKVTKLLPGTEVTILEVTFYGTTKWGKIDQGWVCMDYIAMMDYDDLGGTSSNITSNVAIYEGKIDAGTSVDVYLEADRKSGVVRTLSDGDAINLHELLTVTNVTSDNGTTTTTKKMYWARVNDGYICDTDEDRNNLNMVLALNTLYEEPYTVTGTDLLKVRENPGADQAREDLDLKKGDQVKITQLAISGDQVWGKFEHDDLTDNEGWICLSYCTKGAVDTSTPSTGEGTGNSGNATQGTPLSIGNTGVGNYMGTIIGKYDKVNVRKDPDANAEKVAELNKGASISISETKLVDGRSWGYCGTGWVNLVYVDLTPVGITAIDAKVIATHNTLCYESSETGAKVVGSYASRAVVNIYEEINGMYKTDMGWVSKDNFL